LFPVEDPLGKSIRIAENHYYRVIGVTERKAIATGAGASTGQDYNRDVYIPFETDRVRFGPVLIQFKTGTVRLERLEISQLTVVVDQMSNVKQTAEIIRLTLEQFHPDKDTDLVV